MNENLNELELACLNALAREKDRSDFWNLIESRFGEGEIPQGYQNMLDCKQEIARDAEAAALGLAKSGRDYFAAMRVARKEMEIIEAE